jgi:creatinine amidohydrolase
MIRPYILAETNWKNVQETQFQVAVLPWGATEAHNYHLPYATDNYQCDAVAAESAKLAWEKGAKVIVLPTVPFGVNTGQLDIPLCMNLNPSTQSAILKDLADVVLRAGIHKLVIFNGHGGNQFKQQVRELGYQYPELLVCCMDWYKAADWSMFFAEPGDHAGEMETSMMQLIAPDLVLPLSEAGNGFAKKSKLKAIQAGWAYAERRWTQVTADTGVGNPALSSPEKAQKYLAAVAQNISQFFIELAELDVKNMYE